MEHSDSQGFQRALNGGLDPSGGGLDLQGWGALFLPPNLSENACLKGFGEIGGKTGALKICRSTNPPTDPISAQIRKKKAHVRKSFRPQF